LVCRWSNISAALFFPRFYQKLYSVKAVNGFQRVFEVLFIARDCLRARRTCWKDVFPLGDVKAEREELGMAARKAEKFFVEEREFPVELAIVKKGRGTPREQVLSDLPQAEREKLIVENRDHGYRLAWKFLHHWRIRLQEDDVRSIVGIALCEAAHRFRTTFQTSFRTFLFYHLRGLLLREVGDQIKQRNLHRPMPTFLGDDDQEALSLEFQSLTFVEYRTPEKLIQRKQIIDLCRDACDKLDELERVVLTRHFIEEHSLNDIARDMGYCRCHISRVKNRALSKMNRILEPLEQTSDTKEIKVAKKLTLREPRQYTGGRGRRRRELLEAA